LFFSGSGEYFLRRCFGGDFNFGGAMNHVLVPDQRIGDGGSFAGQRTMKEPLHRPDGKGGLEAAQHKRAMLLSSCTIMETSSTQSIPRTAAVIEDGLRAGLHIGAQIFASIHGNKIADAAFGLSRPGVEMSPDTMMLWLSSTKPVAAVAIGQLWERGLLDLDDLVARHIPEFAVNAKGDITIRHILTHTAGFRGAALNWSNEPWDDLIAKVCKSRQETGWIAGKKVGYNLGGSWLILGQLIRRLDGRPFEKYVREEIFVPLGMADCWIGMPRDNFLAYGQRIGLMHDTSGEQPIARFPADAEEACEVCRPGHNGRGPIRELAFFYEAILGKGSRAGQRILSPQTVEALTSRHRTGMFDNTFKHVMDWSLGFIVSNNIYGEENVRYSFGPHASPRTVGHGGFQSSVGMADPEHGLAAAIVFNGCPGEATHAERIRRTMAALYEDLGLVK
jgi:CubicO group peptidase (beta-lactamase class C family)